MTPPRLKDLRWDIDIINWQNTSLNEPRFRIESVNYDAATLTALIEIRFRENRGFANYEHSQIYSYTITDDAQESISAANIEQFIAVTFPNAVQVEPTK